MLAFVSCALALCAQGAPEAHVVAKVPDGCRVVEGSLHFSLEGDKCVYVVSRGKLFCPVVGSTLGGEYEDVSWPAIDPSGAHTAFRVRGLDPKKKVEMYSILYDGSVLASGDWIGPVALDPAHGVPAFWLAHGRIMTASGRLDAGAATLVWGKYTSAKWQFVESVSPPQFTPDGSLLVTTAARSSGDWNIVSVDQKKKDDEHGNGSIFEAVASPTGQLVAYTSAILPEYQAEHWMDYPQHFTVSTAALDQRGAKSARDHFGEKYESSGSPVYSLVGRHLAFKVMMAAKMGVAIEAQEGAPCAYSFVDELALTADGSAVAYVASNGCTLDAKNGMEVLRGTQAKGGKWFVVAGATRHGEYERAHFPCWSPDGKALAYAAQTEGKWYVFAGSKRSEACDEVAAIAWADNGQRVRFGCLRGNELWWQELDAR